MSSIVYRLSSNVGYRLGHEESSCRRILAESCGKEFQGDGTLELPVLGEIHDAHPAATKFTHDPVAAVGRQRDRLGVAFRRTRRRAGAVEGAEHGAHVLVCREQ